MAKVSDLCNRLGVDAISAGSAIAFAKECYEQGIIKESQIDGLDLSWGNASALVSMVERMGKRQGWLASLLADGTGKAADELGGEREIRGSLQRAGIPHA